MRVATKGSVRMSWRLVRVAMKLKKCYKKGVRRVA